MDLRTLLVTTQQANGIWITRLPELATMWAKGYTEELAIQQWLGEYDVPFLSDVFDSIFEERMVAARLAGQTTVTEIR
jgi:hypothetical protein